MNRMEWIQELRDVLEAELPQNEIDSNVAYYRDYIDRECMNRSQEDVLNELGEARLIAHTIIDTYQMQRGSAIHEGQNFWNDTSSSSYEEDQSNYSSRDEDAGYNAYGTDNHTTGWSYQVPKIKWYHKVIIFTIIAMLLVALFFIGKIALILFIRIGLPILLVYWIFSLIRRR